MQPAGIIAFGKADIEHGIGKMSAKEIDKLACGAIELDQNGTACPHEARISGASCWVFLKRF